MRSVKRLAHLLLVAGCCHVVGAYGADCAPIAFTNDGIEAPLAGAVGDPVRGREIARDPERGDCTICHRLPLPQRQFHGNIGPALDRVGARLSPAQLRARIADPRRLNPHSLMPAYCATQNRYRVALEYLGKPLLSAGEVEDLVAWLSTLDGTAASPEIMP